jgi:Cu-processing system permease protein
MRTIRIIAGLTFREAARRKILLAALAMGGAFLAVFAIGFYYANLDLARNAGHMTGFAVRETRAVMVIAGLYVVNFLAVAMSALISLDTLSGEIQSGAIQTLVAKPVRRWQIVVGKWLGFAGIMTLYVLLMGGGVIGAGYAISGSQPRTLLLGFTLIWLNGMLMLSVSFFGGSRLSTLANGVLAFGLYGIAFVGGWVEQFGAIARKQAAVNVGIVASLIFPSDALWRRAAFEMQSPLMSAIGISPFSSMYPPNATMIVYAALYALVALALAVRAFSRRDL